MKLTRNILIIFTLILQSYFPISAISSSLLDFNVRIYSPVFLSAIALTVTLAALVFSFISGPPSLHNKILAPIICLASAANFSLFLIFADNSTATVLCILSYALSVVLAIKCYSFLIIKIIFPIAALVLGAATFAVSIILAVALALGNKTVAASSLSQDGRYRAEITSQGALTKNSFSVVIYDTDDEVRLPFIHLFPDGRSVFTGSDISSAKMSWENSNTLIVNGERIIIESDSQ